MPELVGYPGGFVERTSNMKRKSGQVGLQTVSCDAGSLQLGLQL